MNNEVYMHTVGRKALLQRGGAPLLFYPGGRVDTDPFTLFCRHGGVEVFLYCDYLLPVSDARSFVRELPGFSVEDMGALAPEDLGVDDWAQLWPTDEASMRMANPATAYALWARLVSRTGRQIFFAYFGTEAVQTYHQLTTCGITPAAVVLQDHGFGGNWTTFGGPESPLWHHAQLAAPAMLYVGEQTKPWPGYRQETDFCVRPGAEHQIPRALFTMGMPEVSDITGDPPARPRGRLGEMISDFTRRLHEEA
jgi:hypothetical protein